MTNQDEKYCTIDGSKMYRGLNSSIWVCPKCLNEQNKAMLGRSFQKKTKLDKEPKNKGKINSKNINKKLDDAWSLLVKLLAAGKCEYCKSEKNLNSHHIFSRSNFSVRWDSMNGICLCVNHHTFDTHFSAHKAPVEFMLWLNEFKGVDFMTMLRLRANNMSHYSFSEKLLILDNINSQIKELQL